jgi:hypothetical protein
VKRGPARQYEISTTGGETVRALTAPYLLSEIRTFPSELPRTRTWNLKIKSLCRRVSARFRVLQIWRKYT